MRGCVCVCVWVISVEEGLGLPVGLHVIKTLLR